MTCAKCKTNPVIKLPNSEVSLCKSCFIHYFERKVRKTIRKYKMFNKGDKIGVAISGGKDSLSLLHVLNKLFSEREINLIAILIDEGIHGYRDASRKTAEDYCKKNNIELYIYTFEDEFGYTLDKALKKLKVNPCTICGIFRRYLLNKYSQKLNIKKLATGHNLDDEAQSILMNEFKSNIATSARLGPVTGLKKRKKFIQRIKPFYFLTEKEIMTYAYLNKLTDKFNDCPYTVDSFRNEVRDMLNKFDNKYQATKYSIIQSFLEVLPLLKKKYKNALINSCDECGEVSSQKLCKACEYAELLKK